jgi:hypothetical protein
MTTARRIARHRPLPAGRSHAAGTQGALGTAMLGAVTGLVFGAAILVGAPVVGGASSTDGARLDGPASLSPAGLPVPVAAVIVPAPGVERFAGQGRQEANP